MPTCSLFCPLLLQVNHYIPFLCNNSTHYRRTNHKHCLLNGKYLFYRTKRQHIAVPLKQEDAQTFDTICLNDPENVNQNQDGADGNTIVMPVLPQKTWTEMHDEFYAEPPKNPGKILLLYSPDTKQFKELQVKTKPKTISSILFYSI